MKHDTRNVVQYHVSFLLIKDYLDYFMSFLISAFSSQLDLSHCLDSF